jgi:hypothetical protein
MSALLTFYLTRFCSRYSNGLGSITMEVSGYELEQGLRLMNLIDH